MTRRLVLFGLVVCSAAVLALVLPLAFAARDTARDGAVEAAQARAQETAILLTGADPDDVPQLLPGAPTGVGTMGVVLPDGTVLGDASGEGSAEAVAAAQRGRAVSVAAGRDVVVASPVVAADGRTAVVLVRLSAADLRTGLAASVAALAGAALVLLATAGITAVVLARRTASPIVEVADVAHQMADGDLGVRASTSGIPEVAEVGVALNRLATRVAELLAEERRSSADLAHRLRTPLTALAVDLDAVLDDQVRARLGDDLTAMQLSVDEIIAARRRPEREGVWARCDAVEVVRARAAFWAVLAEDQHRAFEVRLPKAPQPVRLTREDLETAIDITIQNVFVHTPEGVGFSVDVVPRAGPDGADESARGTEVVVTDRGPGWAAQGSGHGPHRPGTSGLGLQIASRTAQASGGALTRETGPDGGARVRLRLGAPQVATSGPPTDPAAAGSPTSSK